MADKSITFTVKLDPVREEALALADKYVTDWTEQTKNQRGYVHDKWTPVEVQTRTEAVLKVANWLLEPRLVPQEQGPKLLAPIRHATLFGWSPDQGVPSKSTYLTAKHWLREVGTSGQPVQTEAVELAEEMIRVYEDAQPKVAPPKPPLPR